MCDSGTKRDREWGRGVVCFKSTDSEDDSSTSHHGGREAEMEGTTENDWVIVRKNKKRVKEVGRKPELFPLGLQGREANVQSVVQLINL